LRRNRFDLQDDEAKSRLDSLITVIGNTLYTQETQVLIPALRVINSIIKLPLASLDNAIPVIIRQIIELIRSSGSSESELAQTALRTLGIIVRDHEKASIKDKDLRFLLEFIAPDLEESNRQSPVFLFLRGIVSRKLVVPEVYDLMDKVAEIMVTSQSPQTQELCRGLLLQFFLDYPQGKGRWKTQMSFLAKNLSYPHESGRVSVMELLGAVFSKVDDTLLNDDTDMFFMALMLSLANEDSTKCKEMAAALLKSLFQRQDDEHAAGLLVHVHTWASNGDQPLLRAVAFQAYGIAFEVLGDKSAVQVDQFLKNLSKVLQSSVEFMASDNDEEYDSALQWQVVYHALASLEKAVKACRPFPWSSLPKDIFVRLLLFPHTWVRKAACRVIGTLFAESISLESLQFDTPSLIDIAGQLLRQLKSHNCDSTLSLQIVKNLFFIGKKFQLEAVGDDTPESDNEEEEEESPQSTEKRKYNPLAWLFSRISYQGRTVFIGRSNRAKHIGVSLVPS
jgi:U3 small nucleolar RNA-associated protein 20